MVFRARKHEGEDVQDRPHPGGGDPVRRLAPRRAARNRLRGHLPHAQHAAFPHKAATHPAGRQPADGGVPPQQRVPHHRQRQPLHPEHRRVQSGRRHSLHSRPLRRHRDPRRRRAQSLRGLQGEDAEQVGNAVTESGKHVLESL